MMKINLKKALVVSLLLCVSLLVTSCAAALMTADNNPSVALGRLCGYISDGDYTGAFAYAGSIPDVTPSDFRGSPGEMMLRRVASSVRIRELTEAGAEGITASQRISVTHIDLRLVVRKAVDAVMKDTAEYEWKHGSYKTDAEISDAVRASMLSVLEGDLSDCVITEEIDMEYRYRDGCWFPVMNDALCSALTGCASEALAGLDNCIEGSVSQSSSQEQR